MKRKAIFLVSGKTVSKYDCSYLMVRDAVKKGIISYCNSAPAIHTKSIRKAYERFLREQSYEISLFDMLFVPRLSRKQKYIIYVSETHELVRNRFFFNRLKKQYDIIVVMLIRNMFRNKIYPGTQGRSLEDLRKEYDFIITDERKDAMEYGLFYAPDTFSNPYTIKPKVSYDLIFIGDDKGRSAEIKRIAQRMKEKGVLYNFMISGNKESSLIKYIDYIPYSHIIYEDLRSNCILEVLQSGQSSISLRTQEAVCLGKKLITNNKEIVNESFYDPRYIKVFESIDDIDVDFVKERKTVKYDTYNDEFSPIIFFERINRLIENKYG